MSTRVTSRDYRSPHRPALVRWVNRLDGILGGGDALSVEGLLAQARKSSGLSHFADPSFRTPLSVLLESLEAEAQLNRVGRLLTSTRLSSALVNRLRADAIIEADPGIVERDVRRPLFVTGLQRTGTTLLHRLLCCAPDARPLSSWEALNPAPASGVVSRALALSAWGDARVATAHAAEATLRYLAPDFFAIHPIEANAPEEEVVLMDHSFMSTVGEASYHVPSYAAWLEAQDQTPAYAYLKRMLQLLDTQRPAQRWVLKTPHHLEWLDTLFEVFPDATVVWTHRDPLETVPSFCSMVAHGRGIFSDAVDPVEVGRHWLAKIGRMLDRARDTRARIGSERFIDVRYTDVLRDPLGEVARIHRHLELPLSDATAGRVHDWLEHNRQHKHGRHRYEASDFGLSAERIAERLSAYREAFALC
jgi:hypothetical protein